MNPHSITIPKRNAVIILFIFSAVIILLFVKPPKHLKVEINKWIICSIYDINYRKNKQQN